MATSEELAASRAPAASADRPSPLVAALSQAVLDAHAKRSGVRAKVGAMSAGATKPQTSDAQESDDQPIEGTIFRTALARWLADVAESDHGP